MTIAVPPATLQRAEGEGRIAVSLKSGKTRLDTLYQAGAAKIRLPRVHDSGHAEAVLINVGGGLTGGDRFSWTADLAAGSALAVTTQACEKIYCADHGRAEIKVNIRLKDNAALSWLPQEAILFDRSAVQRTIEADMAATARLLVLEPVILGRAAFGETVKQTTFRDRWRIRIDGQLVHAENTKISGDPGVIASGPARLNRYTAFANLILIAADAGAFLAPLRAMPKIDGVETGFSHLPAFQSTKLVARFVAKDGFSLRRALIPVVDLLNRQAMNMDGLPKVWRL